jgi:hypothetical protein
MPAQKLKVDTLHIFFNHQEAISRKPSVGLAVNFSFKQFLLYIFSFPASLVFGFSSEPSINFSSIITFYHHLCSFHLLLVLLIHTCYSSTKLYGAVKTTSVILAFNLAISLPSLLKCFKTWCVVNLTFYNPHSRCVTLSSQDNHLFSNFPLSYHY